MLMKTTYFDVVDDEEFPYQGVTYVGPLGNGPVRLEDTRSQAFYNATFLRRAIKKFLGWEKPYDDNRMPVPDQIKNDVTAC